MYVSKKTVIPNINILTIRNLMTLLKIRLRALGFNSVGEYFRSLGE